MSKHYSCYKGVLALLVLLFYGVLFSDLQAQSMTCFGGLNASLDDSCKVVINAGHIAPMDEPFDVNDFEITVSTMDGKAPLGIFTGSGASYKAGSLTNYTGSIITFTQPGSFKVSVRSRTTKANCWGNFVVEDKLMPKLDLTQDCHCPEDAEMISPECKFSCANLNDIHLNSALTDSLNPVFYDNCGNVGDIFYTDLIQPDTLCGSWYIIRTWKTKIFTAHSGEQVKELACKQKFLFEKVDTSTVLPPKNKVIVDCGINTDPASLRNYFSDTSYFTNPNLDSAVICSYPYVRNGFTFTDSTLVTKTIEKDSIRPEMVELVPGSWTLLNVIIHYTVDSSYYTYSSRSLTPLGLRGASAETYCKLLAHYTDTDRIYPDSDCPNSYKFVRTWKIIDWCNGDISQFTQIIAVMDREAPKFAINDTIESASTNPWICAADLIVPPPIDSTLSDNCSTKSDISWTAHVYKGFTKVTASSANGYKLTGLSPGVYQVYYEVSDQCKNTARDTAYLKVVDNADPVAITKDKIIVTFTQFDGDCTAKIYPHNIDVGSYDACTDDAHLKFEVKRLTDTVWASYVKFSQADIMTVTDAGVPFGEHMIELRVTDQDSNSTIGWTTVRVEDKNSKMEVLCGPDTIRLDCTIDFDDVVLDSLYAPRAILRSCTYTDLNLDYKVLKGDVNSSCNVGSASVAYFLSGTTDTLCIKNFIFGDVDTLRIEFPDEEITVDCSESDFGDVVITGGGCNNLAQSSDDQIFEVPNGAGFCKKIIRRFTIIDWCNYRPNNPNDTTGIYRFTQVIKVKDNTRPVVICQDVTLSAGAECGLSDFQLSAEAIDSVACTEKLTWIAKIDIDGDSIFESTFIPVLDANGKATITVDTLIPSGTYRVWWQATDDCHNKGERICTFTITDTKAPTPQCIGAISTALMNTSGSVSIWAKDYDIDGKSTDECGGQLFYSFSGIDRNVPSLTFDCDDLPNGITATLQLKVYVWDESGNNDFCNVTIRLDDNANVCEDIAEGMSLISGSIKTAFGDDLESAEVKVTEKSNRTNAVVKMTDVSGDYAFSTNPMYYDYSLSAFKNDDVANGVSTLDLVLIQQHILAKSLLTSPYQVLAADVSGDEKISAIDLVEIRKIILGSSQTFSTGKSWDFVSARQTFSDILHPWPITNHIDLYDVDQHFRDQDFIAIKLGDVNGNAIANSIIAGTRSHAKLDVVMQDQMLHTGVSKVISMKVDNREPLIGMQMQLTIEDLQVTDVAINSSTLESQYYVIDNGLLTISIDDMPTDEEIILSIEVISQSDIMISDVLTLNDQSFKSEAYTAAELETYSLNFEIDPMGSEQVEFDVFQNKPNPFSDGTTIEFVISEDGYVDLSIFDVAGKQLHHELKYFNRGVQSFVVDHTDLNSTGVMYYQISSGDNVATRKMIRLD